MGRRPIRVLHVIPAVAPVYGGPSRAVLGMARALREEGVEALVAATDADGRGRLPVPLGEETEYGGAPCVFFRRAGGEALKFAVGFARWLESRLGGFDCVHVHAFFSHTVAAAARACRREGVPYVVRPLGSLGPFGLGRKRWRKALFLSTAGRGLLEGAAAVHFTSRRERDECGLEPARGKAEVIPLGVDGGLFDVARCGGASGTILQLSRLHPVKRTEDLLRAFAGTPAAAGWRLVLAGDGEPSYVASLRRLARSSGAGERVEFAGWADDRRRTDLLAAADLVAAVSSHESFGLSVAEAMAAGVPVVASRSVALAAEVEEAGAGWVAAEDLSDLAGVLTRALVDPVERRRRGERGRALARERFRWDSVARSLRGLYAGILEASPPARRSAVAAVPRRVLLLAPSLEGEDGVSRVGALLRDSLGSEGFEDGAAAWTLAEAGRSRGGGPGRDAGGSRLRFAGWGLREGLRDAAGTLVVAAHLHLAPAALPLLARGARMAVYLHGIECWGEIRGLRRKALAKASLLLANSRFTLDRFRAGNPSLRSIPAVVCPPGVPAEAPAAGRSPVEGPFVLAVGRLSRGERYKGHDLLLDLWPEVSRLHPDLALVAAGDGDDRARLEGLAARRDARARFLGRVDAAALGALYRDSAFFALPSRGEGFGLVYLEAMRAGRACLAGTGAPAEIVVHGETGLVADPADPAAVLRALLDLAGDPGRCARMGRRGRERFLERFTEEAFRERFLGALAAAGLAPPGGKGRG